LSFAGKNGVWFEGACAIYVAKIARPRIIPNITITIIMIITAINAIAKAITHPQSKKCLISPSHIMKVIIAERRIGRFNAPMASLIMIPRRTIQMASKNFALSFPTRDLPEIHRNGTTIIVVTTTLIRNSTGSIIFQPCHCI
jgi:hypothetical protein